MSNPETPESLPQNAGPESFGVETLIGRLRDEGIEKGKTQAQALVDDAKKEATNIVAAATKEAEILLAKAAEEASKLKKGGEESVRLALRDTILSLENELTAQFEARLKRLVGGALNDPGFLQKMILELCRRVAADLGDEKADILLPATLVSLQDLQQKPETAKPGTLAAYVLSISNDMMRAGLSCGVDDTGEAGFKIRAKEGSVEVHLTESAITELMIMHMLPRFRALLRGAINVEKPATQVAKETPAKKLVAR